MKLRATKANGMVQPRMLIIVVALTIICVPSIQAQKNVCVPQVGGLAGLPTLDGIVEGYAPGPTHQDMGWNGATRINLSADQGATRASVFQIGASTTDLYFSFVVDAPQPGADNTIVLVLSTDGNPAHDWRFHIKPFTNATAGGGFSGFGQAPDVVTYWRDSNIWNTPQAVAATEQWMIDNIRFSKDASRWAIELKIPWEKNPNNAGLNSKVYFPGNQTFKLYVNALSTTFLSGTVTQDPWPADGIIQAGASAFLTANTPSAVKWGTASLFSRNACTGVSLTWSDIGVQDPQNPNALIQQIRRFSPGGAGFPETFQQCQNLSVNHNWPGQQSPANVFEARPFNGMASPAKVSAAFWIANWGIPGVDEWAPIGEVPNTPLPPLGVPGNPTPEFQINSGASAPNGSLTATWNLSYRWSCLYSYIPHHCIQVNLDSTDPSVIFLNKSVQKNMDFVPASDFIRTARLSTSGRGKPPLARSKHELLLFIDRDIQTRVRDGKFYFARSDRGLRYPELGRIPAEVFPNGLAESMTWIARGYLKTGNFLIINGTKYEYAKAAGSFGYVVGHQTSVGRWEQELKGEALKQLDQNTFLSVISPDSFAEVSTRITPVETRPGPKTDGCFKPKASTTPFALLVGVLALGLVVYRPRKRER